MNISSYIAAVYVASYPGSSGRERKSLVHTVRACAESPRLSGDPCHKLMRTPREWGPPVPIIPVKWGPFRENGDHLTARYKGSVTGEF